MGRVRRPPGLEVSGLCPPIRSSVTQRKMGVSGVAGCPRGVYEVLEYKKRGEKSEGFAWLEGIGVRDFTAESRV
jgi:hypothetical protein